MWDRGCGRPTSRCSQLVDPAAQLTVRFCEPYEVIDGGNDETADCQDDDAGGHRAHKYWRGEYNFAVGLAKGQVKAKGPINKILEARADHQAAVSLYKEMTDSAQRRGRVRIAPPRRLLRLMPVNVREVGPRDGFQNEPELIPTADKVRLIARHSPGAGLTRIEVTSFVRADVIPQLADGRGVARIEVPDGVLSVLVPNRRAGESSASASA